MVKLVVQTVLHSFTHPKQQVKVTILVAFEDVCKTV